MNKRQRMSLAASVASQPFSISSACEGDTSRASIAIAKGQDTQESSQRKTSAVRPVLAASNRNKSFSPALKRYDSTTAGSGKAATSKDVVSSIIPQNAQQYDYARAGSNAAKNNAKLLRKWLGDTPHLCKPGTDCAPLPLQPVNDADALLMRCEEFLPTFAHMLARCAPSWDEQTKADTLAYLESAGVKLRGPVFADTKSPEDMARKTKEHGGRADMVSDILRGIILVTSDKELQDVYAKLQSTFKIVSEDDRFNNPTGTGRFGYNGIVVLPNKLVAEIRVATPVSYAWHQGQGRDAFKKLASMKPKDDQQWMEYMKVLTRCIIGWNECLRQSLANHPQSSTNRSQSSGKAGQSSEVPGKPVKQSIAKRIGKSLVRAYDKVVNGKTVHVGQHTDKRTKQPEDDEPWSAARRHAVANYPIITNGLCDGRTVREHVPNMDSIGASSTDYFVLPGIREVPLSEFPAPPEVTSRTKQLGEDIRESGEISPLIVMVDDEGPYILEGGHRYDAMKIINARAIPAVVVIDRSAFGYDDVEKSFKLDGRREFQGLRISIENRKGTCRRGTSPTGEKWETKMFWPYGYILGTEGKDGDHLDCYVGPNDDAAMAYVVHQKNDAGGFDEDKVMLGFDSEVHARDAYLAHYDTHKYPGEITAMPMHQFIEKVKSGRYHGKMLKSVAKPDDKEFDSTEDELEYDLKDEKKATKDYKKLSRKVKKPGDKKKLEEMSDDEHKHAGYISDMLGKALSGPRLVLDIVKSQVRGHYRDEDGKRVWVKPYSNKRSRKPEAQSVSKRHQLDTAEVSQEVTPEAIEPATQNILALSEHDRKQRMLAMSIENDNHARCEEMRSAMSASNMPPQRVGLRADPMLAWAGMKSDAPPRMKAFLAVRECLQNSSDAIFRRIAKKEITKGQFKVTYDSGSGTMVIEDNGGGMDANTLQEKFLTLFRSGKSEETEGDSIGGFGVAKAYILGIVDFTKPGAGVTMRSQDYECSTKETSEDGTFPIHYGQEFLPGFRLEFSGIDPGAWGWSDFTDQMANMLNYSDFGGKVDIIVNGDTKDVGKGMARIQKQPIRDAGLPDGVVADAYMPKKEIRSGKGSNSYVFVRIRSPKYGYSLYHTSDWVSNSTKCKHDVLLDVACTVRPKHPDYPFNLARLETKGALKTVVNHLGQQLAVDETSMVRDPDTETEYYTREGRESGEKPTSYDEAEAVMESSSELREVAEGLSELRERLVDNGSRGGGGGTGEFAEPEANVRGTWTDKTAGAGQSPIGTPFIIQRVKKSKSDKYFKMTAKHLKELMAWEMASRIICKELVRARILGAEVGSDWHPGFTLDDEVMACNASTHLPDELADSYGVQSNRNGRFLLLNPFFVTPKLDAMRTPEQQADALSALAQHEIAHFLVEQHNVDYATVLTDIAMTVPPVADEIRSVCGAILSGKKPKMANAKPTYADMWTMDAVGNTTNHLLDKSNWSRAGGVPTIDESRDHYDGRGIALDNFGQLLERLRRKVSSNTITPDDATQIVFTKIPRRAWQCKLDIDKRKSAYYDDSDWKIQELQGEREELQHLLKVWSAQTGAKNERRKVPGVRALKLSLAATFGGEDGQ